MRRRARRVFTALERSLLFEPRLVTLSVADQPLSKVFELLGQASGYKVVGDSTTGLAGLLRGNPAPEKTYRYEWVKVPFWQAVEAVCRDAGLRVQPSSSDRSVRLTGGCSVQARPLSNGVPRLCRAYRFRFPTANVECRN